MSVATRTYRGLSAAERQSERRARLIEAGLDVLGSEGLARMTMTAICARAGLTERYFYESFRNLDELLVAVFDTFATATHAAIDRALRRAQPDLFERCRAAAGALIESLTEDPRKARAYVEAIGSEPLKARREVTMRAYAEVLAEQMRNVSGLGAERYEQMLTLVLTLRRPFASVGVKLRPRPLPRRRLHVITAHDLDQVHQEDGVEEVGVDAAIGAIGDVGQVADADSRTGGGEDRLSGGGIVELLPDFVLDLEDLGHRLDHDLRVGDAFLQLDRRMDPPEGGVAVLLAESALLDPALEQPLGVGDALLQCLHPTREHPHR